MVGRESGQKTMDQSTTYTFQVFVNDDDGEMRTFECVRVQSGPVDSTHPFKGGIRFHPSVNVAHTRTMAANMYRKCVLHKVPFRGGKGGVAIDPSEWSAAMLERVCRAYASTCRQYGIVGPEVDVPAPDVGTTAQMMDWMADEWGHRASVTGKSLAHGGSEGRTEATGFGVGLLVDTAYRQFYSHLPKTFCVQGFGNVGRYTFRYLVARGWRCIGLADHTGYYFLPSGPVSGDLSQHPGTLADLLPGAPRAASRDAFFSMDATVVVLAALEHQLEPAVARGMRCALVAEGANSPLCPGADAELARRQIGLLPDILANAGGVIVSYFEWLQNNRGEHWARTEVLARMDTMLLETYNRCCQSQAPVGLRNRL